MALSISSAGIFTTQHWGLLVAVWLGKTIDWSLPASLTAQSAATKARVARQNELARVYQQRLDEEQEKLKQVENKVLEENRQLEKQAYLSQISQEKEIVLAGVPFNYNFKLFEASAPANCEISDYDPAGYLELLLNQHPVVKHSFCWEYPQIQTHQLGDKLLVFCLMECLM